MAVLRILPKITITYVQTCSLGSIRKISDKDGIDNLWLKGKLYNIIRGITFGIMYKTISMPIVSVDRSVIRLRSNISILSKK